MKLVNPAGRDITTFSTEVNRCACTCAGTWASQSVSGDDGTCNCHWYSSDNLNVNLNTVIFGV